MITLKNTQNNIRTIKIVPKISLLLALFLFSNLGVLDANAKVNDKIDNRPYADLKRWHFGFSVGFHTQDLNFTNNGFITPEGEKWAMEVPHFNPGFCLNVLTDLRLHRYLNLRFTPGLYFGSKSVMIKEYYSDEILRQDIKSAYIVLPFDLKFSGERLHNVRPYITAGIMPAIDLSKHNIADYLQFNKFDTYLTVGFGTDFYLPFFKLIPEIKFCFGLTDILRHNWPELVDDMHTYKFTKSLSKVKSNMFVLTFYFE